jgi:RimJ/RimL family protein N-acetyltransferase
MHNLLLQQHYVLENERVRLEPLAESHFDALLPYSLHEPDTWQYGLVTAAGADNLRHYIAQALADRQAGNSYAFAVFDKKAGMYAGSTRFYDIQPGNQTLQLGYTWYGNAFRGTGLNQHCKYLLLSFAFDNWQMVRVEFRADAANARSIAAMKRIGCTVEGILRQNVPKPGGGRRDSMILSILQSEWIAEKKQQLQDVLMKF